MNKFKICPTCGAKNMPTMIECVNCETDLTGTPIGEDLSERETIGSYVPAAPVAKNIHMVRICECGAKNLPSVRKCSQCGEDISDITPVPDTSDEEKVSQQYRYILASLDGQFTFEISTNMTIIGRENAMKEYLWQKTYVSRKHAEILLEGGKLWIKSYTSTNHTYVNNEQIKDDKYVELHNDDVIGLGGKEMNGLMQDQAAYFRVGIGSCM